MKVTRTSILSGQTRTREINCTLEQLAAHDKRLGLVQNIFPDLSADDREFIMTGITPEEWKAAFGDDATETE